MDMNSQRSSKPFTAKDSLRKTSPNPKPARSTLAEQNLLSEVEKEWLRQEQKRALEEMRSYRKNPPDKALL